jgi:hypothetical protein
MLIRRTLLSVLGAASSIAAVATAEDRLVSRRHLRKRDYDESGNYNIGK